jgi:alkaline phosphatase D
LRAAVSLCAALALAACTRAGGAADELLIAYHFETSTEGWRIAADTVDVDPTYRAEGGVPGGYIAGTDEAAGETWYFSAPASLLALLPSAEGGVLRFSLKQSETTGSYVDDDVVIQGPAGRLSYRFASAPGVEWREFAVPLTASAGWRWNWNEDATDAQMQSVLRHPTHLQIRGEFVTGPDEGALDTVILQAAR